MKPISLLAPALVAALMLMVVGCSPKDEASKEVAAAPTAAPEKVYGAADAAEIQKLKQEAAGDLLLLDVRTPGEYSSGHIEGSVLIPINSVQSRLAEIPRDKKIIVVCATGARSGAVADFLQKQGYPWVKNYTGGVVDWVRNRGLPLVR